MIAIQASERNGPLVGSTQLFAGDEIMLISDQGTMVRTRGDEVSVVGRNTQGVRIIRLKDTENLVRLARIAEPEEEDVFDEDGVALNLEAAEGSEVEAAPSEEAAEDSSPAEGSSSAEGSAPNEESAEDSSPAEGSSSAEGSEG